ncbi:MAG: Trk family potassium uptake protein [Clostridia bacterium]|nr:Trk family potassium uptake protein [Clostridia bacterium]
MTSAITKKLTPGQILVLGFALLIVVGAALLMLPAASADGTALSPLDALFTSASAVCVTGLTVVDTGTVLSVFGQVVVILLIQIGGLGFMTFAVVLYLLAGKRLSLRQKTILSSSVSSNNGGVTRLLKRILLGTAIFELGGAALLAVRFIPVYGVGRGIGFSLFHSVSAFCNAGFDILSSAGGKSESFISFAGDPTVSLTLCALITVGGLGFIVWDDIAANGVRFKKWQPHTKVVLLSSLILTAVGALLFFIFERRGELAGADTGEAFLTALFQSVTARTAGFYTWRMGEMNDASRLLMIVLMFIGASPGGTGGGMKTTSVVLMISSVISSVSDRPASVWGRRMEDETVRRNFNALAIYLLEAFGGVFILTLCGVSLSDAAFECFSAVGTVGLTVGVTPSLSAVARITVILLMFMGRVGSMTVFTAVSRRETGDRLRDPKGKIVTG